MSTLRSNVARVAGVVAIALTTPQFLSGQVSNELILCGASSGTQQSCKTSGYATAVRLTRDFSGNRCNQGSNWGHTDSFIWTNGGCRGEFHVTYGSGATPLPGGPGGGASTRVISCGTPSGAQVECKTNGYATNVRLIRDRSGGRCRQGSNWGNTDSFIWANRGCWADFEVTYRGGTGAGPTTRIISCGSRSGNSSCNAFGSVASVRLVRADNSRLCRQGTTWGYTQGDVWTKAGCRGDFEVTYAGVAQPR
jgi:hypothetical protein